MRIAIMQPTYLPWIGYFGLMDYVDTFVFLDSVQFSKQSWQQRNRIKTHNGPLWLTVPVLLKGKSHQLIKDAQINPNAPFPKKHLRSIEDNYRRAPYFKTYAPKVFRILGQKHTQLSTLTESLICLFQDNLEISTTLISSQAIHISTNDRAERLVEICKKLKATEYVSPVGATDYLEKSDNFAKANIPVSFFNFTHPEYKQLFGEFVPYMSVIDLLFNEGPNSLSIIRQGHKK
ncbi:MAG: WbqC family protein [Patescibacteria group bacterium]